MKLGRSHQLKIDAQKDKLEGQLEQIKGKTKEAVGTIKEKTADTVIEIQDRFEELKQSVS